jgi:hypothetical protein
MPSAHARPTRARCCVVDSMTRYAHRTLWSGARSSRADVGMLPTSSRGARGCSARCGSEIRARPDPPGRRRLLVAVRRQQETPCAGARESCNARDDAGAYRLTFLLCDHGARRGDSASKERRVREVEDLRSSDGTRSTCDGRDAEQVSEDTGAMSLDYARSAVFVKLNRLCRDASITQPSRKSPNTARRAGVVKVRRPAAGRSESAEP